ncbi:hypothetical protein H257_05339 [Aphanomyces astaci]|uniref:Uncharacterized protein n=1 Tax=Aphanomyces astaci TaxID=112090 RepID=W4GPW8_APHAT|nr:hypothetical protein H257_05339 [Aphanomyces astaci]ETV81747.1 hypothetical protein H257_05339 [Aphanomyces astaci]|eukprot:XP_009828484.1 hypothetical protein H257_05339 [Aphanomyces astaci]
MEPLDIEVVDEAEYLRSLVATAASDAAVLRDQIHRRTQLLDKLRMAYMRDVVVVKDRLWKHGIRTDAELAALPSADFKPLLPLFSPAESLLRVRPCTTCGGGADLIQCNDEAWTKAEIAAQVATQQLATVKAAKDKSDGALAAMTDDAATLSRMLVKEQKVTAFLQDEQKRLKGKLDAMAAARSTHHASMEATVVRLQHTVAQLETAATTADRTAATADHTAATAKAELKQCQDAHVAAMAMAADEMDSQKREWQRKVDRCNERQAKAADMIQTLQRDIERFEAAAAAMETRVELKHLQDLNAMSGNWQREVEAHALTKQRSMDAMADLERRLKDALAAIEPTRAQLADTRQQLLQRTRELDAATAQYTALDELFRTKTRVWQTTYDEMDGHWRGTLKLVQCRGLRWRLHFQAQVMQYATWCHWLRHVLVHSKALWGQQRAKLEQGLADKQVAYRDLERSVHELHDQRREVRELTRALEDKLRSATEALKQRTFDHAMANRNVVRAECAISRLELQVQTLTSALERQWEVSGGMLMAAEEAATRHVEAGHVWQATYLDARDEWTAAAREMEAKAGLLMDDVECARRQRQAAEAKTTKCLARLKVIQSCLDDKTFECMTWQQDMAALSADMVSLQQKLTCEHRRVAMYDDMVDNLTNVLRDQQQRQDDNERTIRALRPDESTTTSMDFKWMEATCAATSIQMTWRGWRAQRSRPLKKGIHLMEANHVVQLTHDGRRAHLQRLRLVQATRATAAALADGGLVDVTSILAPEHDEEGRGGRSCISTQRQQLATSFQSMSGGQCHTERAAVAAAKTDIAARMLQNALKWMQCRVERAAVSIGEPGRMALESRLTASSDSWR